MRIYIYIYIINNFATLLHACKTLSLYFGELYKLHVVWKQKLLKTFEPKMHEVINLEHYIIWSFVIHICCLLLSEQRSPRCLVMQPG